MDQFQYSYSNLVLMVFRQIVIIALIVIAFNFEDVSRLSIMPTVMMEAVVGLNPTAPPPKII
jgi:hypothetical protein